ncbi:MAG: glycosyltransferase [Pseudomonadota bacterium]
MHARYHERRRVRQVVAALFCLVSVVYLAWRITIFNPEALFLSVVFYAAELIGFVIALGAIFMSWGHKKRTPKKPRQGLDVDVFVTVYNEPFDVVRRTVRAAKEITYPHRTIVLDDGRRPEIRELSEALGCDYFSRAKNDHAKAGNLNFGLGKSTAEFVMVLDADHIALPHALDALLGYFDDESVCLVQSPQDFYNLNSIQFANAKNRSIWHDQSYFYHVSMPNADTFNGTICVGTGVVYRRTALDEIGGIPTDTVTEDLHTSLKMHKRGMETVFHHESIAYGIGEIGLSDYYKVRLRWGHGNIHALRRENVLFCSGLNWRQRLNYLLVGIGYLEGWQYLIFYMVPIYSLLTGIAPFEITLLNISLIMTFPLLTYLLVQEFACGFGRFWLNEVFSMKRFPIAILATFAAFRNKLAWKASKKVSDGKIEWSMATPQILVMVSSIAAILFGVIVNWDELAPGPALQLMADPGSFSEVDVNQTFEAGYNLDLLIVAGLWSLLNVARVVYFLGRLHTTKRDFDGNYAFEIPTILRPVDQNSAVGDIRVASISMSRIFAENPRQVREVLRGDTACQIFFPNETIEANVTRAPNNEGLLLSFDSVKERDKLERILYNVRWHRELFYREAKFQTPLGSLARWFTWRTGELASDLEPTLVKDDSDVPRLSYIETPRSVTKQTRTSL